MGAILMVTAYIGMGSNLGDRMANLAFALDRLADFPETHVEQVSNAYESLPAYVEHQPRFLNAVVEVTTGLEADVLLERLLELEIVMGRVREEDQGPRVIDLDLLLFGEEEWHSEALTLPHPGIAERDFVLTPLLEIAPRITLPDGSRLHRGGATVGEVVGEAGPIPDRGPLNEAPIEPTDWVAVAESETTADRIVGFDASLQLKGEVLGQEGIPVAWDPHEPGADVDPFGFPVVFKLLVPVDDQARAREVLAAVDAAPPQMPAGDADNPAMVEGQEPLD